MNLDSRQRAMLAEMQVPVWWPAAAEAPAPAPVPVPVPPPVRAPSTPKSIAQVLNDTPELIAAHDHSVSARAIKDAEPAPEAHSAEWPALQACVPLNTASATADWLVLGEALGVADAAPSFPVPEAQLLANMLHAVGIRSPGGTASAYIASLLKTPQPGTTDPWAQHTPALRQLVARLQPQVILALGPFAAQLLLRDATPLGQLRGRVHRYHGIPVVVSYHPSLLLRNPLEKAKAWADLCLALGALA